MVFLLLTGCGSESKPTDAANATSSNSGNALNAATLENMSNRPDPQKNMDDDHTQKTVSKSDGEGGLTTDGSVKSAKQGGVVGNAALVKSDGMAGDAASVKSDNRVKSNDSLTPPKMDAVKPLPTSVETPVAESERAIPDSVRERLDKMVATYAKTNVYSDQGMIYVRGQNESDDPIDMDIPFVTVFERPNRLRLEAYTTTMIVDGQYLVAFIDDFPNQVLRRAAPQRLAVGDIFADPFVTESLSQGAIFRGRLGFTQSVAWLSPPLLLLLDDQPLRTLLDQATAAENLSPETYRNERVEPTAEFLCDRVKIVRSDGDMILWIDAKTNILRRLEYPIAEYPQLKNFSITADFLLADFAQPPEESVFAYEIPDSIPVQERLLPPREPAASVIGKPVPDFVFSSASVNTDEGNGENGGDGKDEMVSKTVDWMPKNCADRPLMLVFWATYAPESLELLDALEPLADKYRDQIRILAVNTDAPTVSQAAIDVKWRAKNDTMLSVRDTAQPPIAERFGITSLPTTYFVGTDGNVQDLIVALPIREDSPTLPKSAEENGNVENSSTSENTKNTENTENTKNESAEKTDETSLIDVAGVESRISQLLAGNGLATQRLSEINGRWNDLMTKFEVTNTEYQQWLKAWLAYGRYRFVESLPSNRNDETDENGGNTKILPATIPLILKPRTTIALPQIGALTTVTRTDTLGMQNDTLYGLRNWANFVEFDANGGIVREIPIGKTSQDILSSLRFAKDGNDECWVAFGSMAPRIYCFDTMGKIRWVYPEKIPNLTTAKGVVDVEIVDLDDDGTSEVIVGLSGSGLREEEVEGGILCLDANGKQKWWNPQVLPAQKFTLVPDAQMDSQTEGDAETKHDANETNMTLVVPAQSGTLLLLDPKTGLERRRLEPPDPSQWVPWIAAVRENGKNVAFAGLRFNQLGGDWSVIAFGRDGQPLWTTPIGSGNYELPVEQLFSANFAETSRSLTGNLWLVPGPDGTFSILSSDGAILEHFATGKPLTGAAVLRVMDGETATERVVLSDADGMTIFDVP